MATGSPLWRVCGPTNPTGNLGPAKNNHVNWGWVGRGGHRGAAIEPAETWKIASKQKHRRPSESRFTAQAPPATPPPAEPILRDGTVSYQSEQQRLQIYGPLKLAIKIQRSCSFSRLEEPLGTLVPHTPPPPPVGSREAPPGVLNGSVFIGLWSGGGNRHTLRSQIRSRPQQKPAGGEPAVFFIPRPLWTDQSGTAPTCSHHNSIFVEKKLIFSRETPTANISHMTEQYAD